GIGSRWRSDSPVGFAVAVAVGLAGRSGSKRAAMGAAVTPHRPADARVPASGHAGAPSGLPRAHHVVEEIVTLAEVVLRDRPSCRRRAAAPMEATPSRKVLR